MLIRQLDQNDIEAFFTLRLEALEKSPTAFGSSYEEEKARGPSFHQSILSSGKVSNVIFGVFEDNKLVGTIGIYSDHHLKSRHKATIWGMYVQERSRGNGFAKALVTEALKHAKSRMGVRTVNLSVETTNIAARTLYLSCGFKTWGREPESLFVHGKYYDEDHLYLNLIES